jgi:hypothetical protein
MGLFLLKIVKRRYSGTTIEQFGADTTMKKINEKANHLKTQLLEWVLIKGPELFIAIYG